MQKNKMDELIEIMGYRCCDDVIHDLIICLNTWAVCKAVLNTFIFKHTSLLMQTSFWTKVVLSLALLLWRQWSVSFRHLKCAVLV